MENLTVKLPRALNRRLRDKARQSGRSKSDVARECIERTLTQQGQASCHELMKPACGHAEGRKDASSLEGFGD